MPSFASGARPTRSLAKNLHSSAANATPTPARSGRNARPGASVSGPSPAANPQPLLSAAVTVASARERIIPQTAVGPDPVSDTPVFAVNHTEMPEPGGLAKSAAASLANSESSNLGHILPENVPSGGVPSSASQTGLAPQGSTSLDAASPAIEKTAALEFSENGFPANVAAALPDPATQIQPASQPGEVTTSIATPIAMPVAVPTPTPVATPSASQSDAISATATATASQIAAMTDPIATLTQGAAVPSKSADASAEMSPLTVAAKKPPAGQTPDPSVSTMPRIVPEPDVASAVPDRVAFAHPSRVPSATDDLFSAPRALPHLQQVTPTNHLHSKEVQAAMPSENADATVAKAGVSEVSTQPDAAVSLTSAVAAATSPAAPAAGFVVTPGSAVTSVETGISPPTTPSTGGANQLPPSATLKLDVPQPPAPNTGPVQIARLVDGIAQSEMHIGLRTQAFGNVELHTVVRDSQVGLAVGSEKGNLRNFLNSEVPTLQATLGQHDIRFDGIRFLESGGAGTGFSGGTEQQSRSFHQAAPTAEQEPSSADPPDGLWEEGISAERNSQISVLA
jgi:hypothetical protein